MSLKHGGKKTIRDFLESVSASVEYLEEERNAWNWQVAGGKSALELMQANLKNRKTT